MKKGYIGPFQLGALEGMTKALEIAGEFAHEDSSDIENIFYTTAFQAGIDEFLIPDFKDRPRPRSDFIDKRTTLIPSQQTDHIGKAVTDTFSSYLPDDWRQNEEYHSVTVLMAFVRELLEAMSSGASLLTPWGIPDMAEAQALLPSELSVPLTNLLSAISEFQGPSPIPLKAIATEDLERFNEIISSDLFSKYSAAQSALDDQETSVDSSLPTVITTGRNLFLGNLKILQLRKSSMGILQFTPKLVDAIWGKFPGVVAEIGAKLGISLLESRRRVVIYDFRPSIEHLFFSEFIRLLKVANSKMNE